MKFAVGSAIVAAFVAAAAAGPAQAAGVILRVEGATGTLVAPTAVTTASGTFTKTLPDANTGIPVATQCGRDSAGGALEIASGGDWTGLSYSFGQTVEAIKGESHRFSGGSYWSVYVNDRPASVGACSQQVQAGDVVTFYPQCAGAPGSGCFDGLLILSSAPATAAPGDVARIAVDQVTSSYDANYNTVTKRTAAEGAVVAVGGATAVAGADGIARVRVGDTRGVQPIRVTLADRARTSGALCVTDGADGECGTQRADTVLGAGPQAAAGATAPTRDADAPRTRLTGLTEQQRFVAGKGPRRLSGSLAVPDPSGLLMVKLRIVRRAGDRCAYFSGRLERLRPVRCGATNGKWFSIGDRSDWSYLLPARLPRGRYVIDAKAIDRAYNRDEGRERGRNRMVVRVG